jgi:DNA-binding response OmpR family regulator
VSDKRLLIIDDEPEVGVIIRQIAEDCGFDVEATTSADEFRAAYSTFRPTAIIVDLAVPNTDGIQLFRWLADEHCAVPIVIVSGFDDKVLESAKRLGEARGLLMDGIITKPMRAADISGLLNGLVGPA